jgi:hypothetical protein
MNDFAISDERLAEIGAKSYAEAIDRDWHELLLSISERTTSLADLEQAVSDSAVEIARLTKELEQLRRPVEVELVGEDYALIQEIRNDPLVSYPHSKLKKLLRIYDSLAQDHVKTVNAWQVQMGYAERYKMMHRVAEDQLNAQIATTGEFRTMLREACEERDEAREAVRRLRTQLTEALEDIEQWAGYASEYFQEKHDLTGCLQRHRAALAQPQAKTDPGSPWAIKFCEYEDCDGDPAPGSTLCQGHIDDNARIAAEEQQRRAQPQGEQEAGER